MKNEHNQDPMAVIEEYTFQIAPAIKKHISRMPVFRSDRGLPLSHYQLLSLLKERGSMSVSELSDYFSIAKPNITPMIDRLVNEELVERVRSVTDRRIVNIHILPTGEQRLEQIHSMLNDHISSWRECLTESEFNTLAQSMKDLCQILDKL